MNICDDLNQEFKGVSAEVCKAYLSTVIAALLSNRRVRLKYEGVENCNAETIGAWDEVKTKPEYLRVFGN